MLNLKSSFRFSRPGLATLSLILATQIPNYAHAQECVEKVERAITTDAWVDIKKYFSTLLDSPAKRNKAELIRLRASIVSYEGEKQKLVEILSAHSSAQVSGSVAKELSLGQVPDLLKRIDSISSSLNRLANEANLFAAESSFRALVVTMSTKRALTLCSIHDEAMRGFENKATLRRLQHELTEELNAITSAEDALGSYIRRLP